MPATKPIIIASRLVTESQFAVIPTSPAKTPLRAMVRSGFLNLHHAKIIAQTAPADAARVVFTAINMTAFVLSVPTIAN